MQPWIRRLMFGKIARLVRIDVPPCRTLEYLERQNRRSCCDAATAASKEESMMNNNINHASEVSETEERNGKTNGSSNGVETFSTPGDEGGTEKRRNSSRNGTVVVNVEKSTRKKHGHSKGSKSSKSSKNSKSSSLKRCRTLKNYEIADHKLRAENTELLAEDWKRAARVLDRVMLATSVIIGVLSVMIIFIQPPRVQMLFMP